MCGRSWTPVSFLLHVKYTVSYRIVSHGRVTSVVRATPLVNGRGQIYPSHQTHAPQPTVTEFRTRIYVNHICRHAKCGSVLLSIITFSIENGINDILLF